MGTISVSLPADGTTADVADYNTPITTIVNEINGNLSNENIASDAAIAGSKFADNSINLEAKASSDSGWREVTDSWAYASATTITVPAGAADIYSVGDKIRLTQTSTKYFYIVTVADTLLTVTGGTDYTVANAAITDISYSKVATPVGFPQLFSYTPTLNNFTLGSGTINYAKFSIMGKRVNVRIKVTLSSSTVSGLIGFSLPVAMNADYSAAIDTPPHSGQLNDATGSRWEPWLAFGSSTRLDIYYPNDSNQLTGTSSTAPFTWANNDNFMISVEYDI